MAKDASRLHDLTDLTTGQGSSTVYPTEDSLLSALHARFRSDLPYTRIGGSTLVAINPLKSLASVNDASAQDYEQVTYRDTESDGVLQPHIYEMASRAYLVMRRTNRPQSVVFRGIAASGKSYNARLLTNQLLRLSTHSKRDAKVAEQIKALHTLLDSFGQAKTALNPSASRHNRYLELQFSDRGRIAGAKTLLFGLDKSRLIRLGHEERSFHIFYQLIAGAYPEERDQFYLEDPSEYALLASSGCYRLPAGPFSDDSVAMEEVRAAFKLLGFKSKNVASIFNLLVVILLLGNIQFYDVVATNKDQPARITNPEVLERAAHHLSISAEDLAQALVNKTNYVRKELYTVFLTAEACRTQLNHLIADLYAILFSYIVEMANAKLDASPSAASESGQEAPPPQPLNHIVMFDSPGFYSRTSSGSISSLGQAPLISAQGQNSFEEFSVNFVNEIIHSHMVRLTFEDSAGYNSEIIQDGISLPSVNTMDNSACVELLRGVQLSDTMPKKPGGILGVMGKAATAYRQGKSSGDMSKDEQNLLSELVASFGVHASFVSNPAQDRNVFAINHYAGQCTYDVRGFIEKDADVLDSAFVSLLRQSSDGFISRLVSGPSLAVERHHKDQNTVVQAQVTSRPLRQPSVLDEEAQASLPVQDALDPTRVYPVTTQLNASISQVLRTLSQTTTWTVNCIRPNDSGLPNSFDKRRIKLQIRSLLLPDHVARRQVEYMVDYDHDAFCERYSVEGGGELIGAERIRAFARAVPWMREGVDFAVGHRKVWFTYPAWKAIDDGLRADEKDERKIAKEEEAASMAAGDEATTADHHTWKSSRHDYAESVDELLLRQGADPNTPRFPPPNSGVPRTPGSADPFRDPSLRQNAWSEAGDARSDFGPGADSQYPNNDSTKELVPGPADGSFNIKELEGKAVEEVPTSAARRWWVRFVWMQTWWIPTYLLTKLGRMKRPDVRLAWREKVTICLLIFYICGFVIFLILGLGRIICPEFNKAWTRDELLAHTNDDDFWVAVYGQVYDLTNFWRGNHGVSVKVSDSATMKALAGQDLTNYFPIPFTVSCPGLVNDEQLTLNLVNETEYPTAVHTSGSLQTIENTDLRDPQWFMKYFLPKMKDLRKGQLVFDAKKMRAISQQDESVVKWAIWDGGVYDLSDYFNTLTLNGDAPRFKFMDDSITSFWTQQAGQDISKGVNAALAMMDEPKRSQHTNCLNNAFYRGVKDFRNSARCAAPNWILVGFAVIIGLTILAKFLAALQLSGKRNPEMLDKFVICQVPCYTEGEESLRRTIDSLAALRYDDKRKLIFLICDGNIIGSGNDRPTPRIVLDILGVDPKLDPEPLLFKSIAEGSKQLNYGKVYSGLYEFEGHVVPYMVVVKVGKPSERTKPGNRGKRDSQILLLHYLNRVHFDGPMSPLELEIYHQMRNVIGIDPAFYEYIFMVDADTSVTPDSLNRLVACTSDDSQIIAICGETKLDNEEGSWWTMIQVYEYYISHHLSKAFESLFGSVTCLPGCFSMYRIRTADKGRPLIISSRVIDDYSENIVDTLHKKNLLHLGEDRYLTTLMMKHFPTFKMKFTPDAIAHTVAPDRWEVLLSQRRRWINSTIHNLCELVFLPDLCGVCCFSMRFIVFIDLLGTIILPSTAIYLVYLIVSVATTNGPIPYITLAMLAAVYGLQAIIFLLKREFMLIGWMIIYIIAYPVYSFFLPVYAFWCMDDFSWGNTRLVVGEGANKKVIMDDDEKFDESMIPLKKFSEYEAEAWETGSQQSGETRFTAPKARPRPSQTPNRSHSGTPVSFHQASQSGDYFRDTNLVQPTHTGNRGATTRSMAGMSQFGAAPQLGPIGGMGSIGGVGSIGGMGSMGMGSMSFHGNQYGPSGPGSVHGSEFGGFPQGLHPQMTGMFGTGSMYGPMMGMGAPGAPRNSVMTNLNMFGGPGSVVGDPTGMGSMARPLSTFSVDPFGGTGPSPNDNPSDEELLAVLRHYLSTQDLMTVTKKTARAAVEAKFPRADLSSRKDFLNRSIDSILSST